MFRADHGRTQFFDASFQTFQVHLRLIADDQTSTMIVHKAGSFQDWCVGLVGFGVWQFGRRRVQECGL